jgi:hypothetical protein
VVGGVAITFVDITELKRAEERASQLAELVEQTKRALLESEERLRQVSARSSTEGDP